MKRVSRVLSLLLVLVMVCATLPLTAMANNTVSFYVQPIFYEGSGNSFQYGTAVYTSEAWISYGSGNYTIPYGNLPSKLNQNEISGYLLKGFTRTNNFDSLTSDSKLNYVKNPTWTNVNLNSYIGENHTVYFIYHKDPSYVDYAINYHENGGNSNSAPSPTTGKSNTGSCTLTVDPKEPTHSDTSTKFLGWATTSTATEAEYRADDPITLTSSAPVIDLYAVWEKNTVIDNVKYSLSYNLNGGRNDQPGFTPVEHTISATSYTFKITDQVPEHVDSDQVFKGWAESLNGEVKYAAGGDITLYRDAPSMTLYAVWGSNEGEVPVTPDKPTEDQVKALIGAIVSCETDGSGHAAKDYALADGSYTISDILTEDGNKLTVSVAVTFDESYLTQYNTDTGKTHKLMDEQDRLKTIYFTLEYSGEEWVLAGGLGESSYLYRVVCDNTSTGGPGEAAPGGAVADDNASDGELDDVPKTGDSSMMLLGGMTAFTMAAIAVLLFTRKRMTR